MEKQNYSSVSVTPFSGNFRSGEGNERKAIA